MKKFRIPIFTLLAISLIAVCCEGCKFIRVYRDMTAGDVTAISVRDTIPFEYRNNKLIIKAKVNGREYDFVLDTGAPTVIWEEVALDLQLPKTKASFVSKDANGTEQKLEFYHTEAVTVGNLKIENMNMASTNTLAGEVRCYANGGIIGGNFLMHYNWQIDYDNKRLIASSDISKLKIPKDATKVDVVVTRPQGQIIIGKVRILGEEEDFVLDTGNGGSINLAMEKLNIKEAGDHVVYVETYGYSSGSTGGRKLITSHVLQTDVALPMDTIHNAIIHVNTKSSLLGNEYLAQFGTITLENTSKQQAVYFNKKKAKAAAAITYGFDPIFHKESNSFIIGKVYKDSEAERLGLQVNDKILAINGTDLSTIDYATYCSNKYLGSSLYTMEGETVGLKILRDGKKMDIKIRRSPLFH
ncbi:asp_protease [Flammeovirgaceae bacterium 311]|nr:asp_protease [Flammeovirgaceae bacterium 311]